MPKIVTRIYRLNACSRAQRERIRDAQLEAARVYESCVSLHADARATHDKWPGRTQLQEQTKGLFALHSQTVQIVCHEFLANVETTLALRKAGDRRASFPKKSAKYRPLSWPAQAVCVRGNHVLLPMGRGRKSLVFDRPADFPEVFGTVRLCFDGGRYSLHVPVERELEASVEALGESVLAACDLGEIHLGALVTTAGDALVVSGRGIRSVKRRRHKQLGRLPESAAAARRARSGIDA